MKRNSSNHGHSDADLNDRRLYLTIKKSQAQKEQAECVGNGQHASISEGLTPKKNITDFYDDVYSLIPIGKESAVSMGELSYSLKMDARTVRKIIQRMRQSEKPIYLICGDDAGYYQPADNEELYRWYKRRNAGLKTTLSILMPACHVLMNAGMLKEVKEE